MGSPQKRNVGQLYESPYARHTPQYPSQAEGFVPNEFGGNGKTPSKQQYHGNNYHQNNSNQRRRGNNRYFNTQRGSSGSGGGNNIGGFGGGGGGGGGSGGGGGYRNQNSFQNNYNDHQGNRYSNSGNRQQPYHGQKYNRNDGNSRNDYYHPSMLSDPWKDLLERHNAIQNSQINNPSTTTNDSDREPTPSSSSSSPEQSSRADENERSAPRTTPGTKTSPSIPT